MYEALPPNHALRKIWHQLCHQNKTEAKQNAANSLHRLQDHNFPIAVISDEVWLQPAERLRYVRQMLTSAPEPSMALVIGEASKGDLRHRKAFERVASTGYYSASNGFLKHGGQMLGMMVFKDANPPFRTFSAGVQAAMMIEDELRKEWKLMYENDDVFLAQPNDGSGGSISLPTMDARDYVLYFYSHAMPDVERAKKRQKGGQRGGGKSTDAKDDE